jgi:phospholipase C
MDSINSLVNTWLLGETVEGDNGCQVQSSTLQGDEFAITYSLPPRSFVPVAPAGWPTPGNPNPAFDFSPGNLANIDHIVVLTMENRSFDQMLGYLSLPPEKGGMGRSEVDGLKGTEFNVLNGKKCPSFAVQPQQTIFTPDPPHSHEPVAQAINGGKMDGFVQSYAEDHGPVAGPNIMGYHTGQNVPVYDALARDFAICHRWFAPHPGPTFCNRFYELTGRLNIRPVLPPDRRPEDPQGIWEFDNSSPLRPVFTDTIFDHLPPGVSWKYFENAYCFLRFFQKYTFNNTKITAHGSPDFVNTNIVSFDDPVFGFVNLARNGALPNVSFIDPHFIELPPNGNCDGPPADVKDGQAFVETVVNAVVSSPLWPKTMLIIIYDEHGGFYDHVPPPQAAKVSPESLDTYGVRIPAFVISPWVKAGAVFGHDDVVVTGPGRGSSHAATSPSATSPLRSLHFDSTSILKTIVRRFMSLNPPYMGARYEAANDLSVIVESQMRSPQFLPFIVYNLLYAASGKRLEVQNGGLQQSDPNGDDAQLFSFEDAGGGFVYLRTRTGRLYVTADATLGIKQDVKYPPAGGSAAHNPDSQKWKFTASSPLLTQRNNLTVSNAAFPGKVLLPTGGSTASGAAVVLGDPQPSQGVLNAANAWQVTSPRLGDPQVVVKAPVSA